MGDASAPLPVVALDEAGNTGENLLDVQQPVFSLAAVHLPLTRAQEVVSGGLARTQMSEVKFGRLRSSAGGRRNLLAMLDDAALSPETAAASVTQKAYMVAAKMVDELVEAVMRERGRQAEWYGSGEAAAMARCLFEHAERELGSIYEDMVATFVPMVRDYQPAHGQRFESLLRQARIVARTPCLVEVLDNMLATEALLQAEFSTRSDALDPALPSLFWHGGEWSERLGSFEAIHDESVEVQRWAKHLEMAADAEVTTVEVGRVRVVLPHGLRSITFSASHEDPRVQVADLLAGATAHTYEVLCGLRDRDSFSKELERRGVVDLIQHSVGSV